VLSVPGIDAGIIGPFDLSYDMGFGSPLRWDEPRYVGAYDILAEAARKAGKASGAFMNELDRIPWLLDRGHRVIVVGEADAFLIRGAKAALDAAHSTQTA
ncbi:MAG: hypothetical protein KAQ74_00325, partial [Dehalococcoidia bacterium]|nr:hypothetical protein [Dehalococcoidia bacterium]